MDPGQRSQGPSPTGDEPDGLLALEDWMSDRDHEVSEERDTTASGQVRGATLNERLAEEDGRGTPTTRYVPQLGELDGPDDEAEMLGTDLHGGDEVPSSEEAAMRVTDDPPGATDHPDDMARDDGAE
jgi:hypothetical protein